MKEELDFSLPDDNKIEKSGRRFTGFPTIVSIIVIIVMLGFIVQEIYDQLGKKNHVSPTVNPEEEKSLAKRLEDRNLSLPAAPPAARATRPARRGGDCASPGRAVDAADRRCRVRRGTTASHPPA